MVNCPLQANIYTDRGVAKTGEQEYANSEILLPEGHSHITSTEILIMSTCDLPLVVPINFYHSYRSEPEILISLHDSVTIACGCSNCSGSIFSDSGRTLN